MAFLSDRRATSAIEFAILSPVFILVLVGMTAYGIYFGASHSVQQIAADAARAAIAGLDEAERKELAASYVGRNAGGYVLIDPDRLSVEVRDAPGESDRFTVALAYDASRLPIWNLLDGLALPDTTIVRGSSIRIGGI